MVKEVIISIIFFKNTLLLFPEEKNLDYETILFSTFDWEHRERAGVDRGQIETTALFWVLTSRLVKFGHILVETPQNVTLI